MAEVMGAFDASIEMHALGRCTTMRLIAVQLQRLAATVANWHGSRCVLYWDDSVEHWVAAQAQSWHEHKAQGNTVPGLPSNSLSIHNNREDVHVSGHDIHHVVQQISSAAVSAMLQHGAPEQLRLAVRGCDLLVTQ